ncbi:MAG: hypothetical protein J0H17_11120 [Rhizobiales bacterium]|nr:hypothetical protein [Hyphomicrobiales bacterium]
MRLKTTRIAFLFVEIRPIGQRLLSENPKLNLRHGALMIGHWEEVAMSGRRMS